MQRQGSWRQPAARATCQLIGLSTQPTRSDNYTESTMPRESRYAVKFVGYSAFVIPRKYGRNGEASVADLNFGCGVACMHADGGLVIAPTRIDLKPFLERLPKVATELQEALLRERNSGSWVEVPVGPNNV